MSVMIVNQTEQQNQNQLENSNSSIEKSSNEKFLWKVLLQNLQQSIEDPNQIKIDNILCVLNELIKLFNGLGSALSIAFKDIKEKHDIIKLTQKKFDASGMQQLIDFEISLQIEKCNGQNNKKITKNPEFKDYTSASRSMLRMMWLYDYCYELFQLLLNDQEASLSTCCREAYTIALSPNHNFALRILAKTAFLAVPKRQYFQDIIIGEQNLNVSEFNEILKQLAQAFKNANVILWKFYQDKKIDKLE